MAVIAPYGTWTSPITAERIASAQVGLGQIALDGADAYWVEARPTEAGRCVLVRCGADGVAADVTPAPFSARTRVHEYGGGAFAVRRGTIAFTHFADQQIYLQVGGGAPVAITAAPALRFADLAFDPQRPRLFSVCEDHSGAGEPRNSLVAVALDGSGVETLVEGHDFFSNPRPSPDGAQLAWLTWEHPDMPWDATRLWRAPILPDGRVGEAVLVAGGGRESICQPEWSPDGRLHFVTDRDGWWALAVEGGGVLAGGAPRELGAPQWIFGQAGYACESAGGIVCSWVEDGIGFLGQVRDGALAAYDLPFTDFSFVRAAGGRAVFRAAGPAQPAAVIELDCASGAWRALRRSSEDEIDAATLSHGEPISFDSSGGARAHAFFYRPRNRDVVGPPAEKPPLLVMTHGGPTSAASNALNLRIQFWTSRGFAVLDVNYRGSTGFGRAYRESLYGQWGVADVDDCVRGAAALVARGEVDGRRLAITGGSAGGYTTLCAVTFHDSFAAGASYYGISDLEALARDTHKFESHYEEELVGPYPARRDLYRARSPLHHVERLSCPMIFFQGLDDRVVPPNQTEAMVAALRARGIAVEYLAFAGEGHGFRKAEAIRAALEAELAFYQRVLL